MKITVFYSQPFSAKNGPSGVMKRFADYHEVFKDHGKNEFLAYAPKGGAYERPSAYTGKQTLKKRLRNAVAKYAKKTYIGGLRSMEKLSYSSRKVVKDYLKLDWNEDVIIFNAIHDCYQYLKLRKKDNKAKIIMAIRSDGQSWEQNYMYYPKLRNSAYSRHLDELERITCDAVDAIVFVSEHSKATFLRTHEQYKDKTVVIVNGGSPRALDLSKRTYDVLRLVSVGNVSVRKNQIAILRCLNSIEDKSIRLTLVGAGDKLQECRDYAKANGMLDRVEFLGDRNDVPEILERCNAFIMTSFNEGLPNAGVEALRSGLPMIMTDAGGNAELVKNNGIVVSTDDKEIEQAIRFFNDNLDKLAELGKASRELFENEFTGEKMMQRFYSLAKKVCDK